jgi:hypothetical protein
MRFQFGAAPAMLRVPEPDVNPMTDFGVWSPRSRLIEGFFADPPLAGGGAMKVDASILHALVEGGEVQVCLGNGVGQ